MRIKLKYLFKVCSDHDIPINEKTGDKALLPFIKCNQIKIECENIFDYKISFENKKLFCLNKNSLVIVENKIKFPSKKEDLMKYTFLLLKKLNIVIKLIKNTTKNIKNMLNLTNIYYFERYFYLFCKWYTF